MARSRFCRICHQFHELDQPWPEECMEHWGKPTTDGRAHGFATPTVIGDTIAPLKCMADGQVYESKRAISATHKRMGMIEVGNERPPPRKPWVDKPGIRNAAIRAIKDHQQGRRPGRAP